ncbi:MAG TPA: SapC family protein [Ideonella sp.]|uniref:SapC family protein n=1 Tax=Ideonella sp. TaxID=1929293 RepID=UPI002E31404C|nr:SapC family protein [Ideonella sp.]HEX5688226.1 SapC family protein [Ideonella sp.]
MTRPVLLNNVDHKDLRVITRRGAAYGDDVMLAVTFPSEFRNLQAHYPIVFQKSHDGTTFQPVALFGFRDGQNLFLRGDRWDAHYLPLAIERQPFLIGVDRDELMVHVDLDNPRVSLPRNEGPLPSFLSPAGGGPGTGPGGLDEGEPVFLPYGGMTEYLDRINSVLLTIHQGLQDNPAFSAALLQHELLEPFALDIERADGSQHRFSGFYTIHEERLHKLGGHALEQLNQAGHLLAIYMAVASLSRLRDLIERANSGD